MVTAAVTVIACLALAGITQEGPARAAAHPQPAAPVIDYLPHPVGPVAPDYVPATQTTSVPVYLICLYNTRTHCVGANLDSGTATIISAIITGVSTVLAPIIWRLVVSRGSTPSQGDTTPEDEGVYKGKHAQPPNEFHSCLGANPTAGDGNNGVYPSNPSKCFGVLRQSWLYQEEPNGGYSYDMFSRQGLAEHQNLVLAQLNLRDGAYEYVEPDSRPGLWTTIGFYLIGTCTAHC